MEIFGFNTSDPAGLQKALQASEKEIETIKQVVADAENRIAGIVLTVLAQLDGASIEIPATSIKLRIPDKIPKAEPVSGS